MSDGESIAGREREVTFHTSSALTPHFFTEFDKEARSRESRDPFYHDAVRLVEEYRAALNTITQQAQELGRCKSEKNDAVIELYRKLDAKDAELAAAQARCREMEREIETLTTCSCEGCDDNLEESAFCFPCMNKVQQQVTQLQATLAAREARIVELEDWQKIAIGSGTDQETVIRMAANEYTKTAVQCWKDHTKKIEAERDAAVQEAGRLKEAAASLTCEVCKMDMQRALKGA